MNEAVQCFEKALSLAPNHALYLLNLADALALNDNLNRSQELYQRLLDELPTQTFKEPWQELSLEAQASAHLGMNLQAVDALLKALALAPAEPQLAYEASLVYAVLAERSSAVAHGRRALKLGLSPVWFRLPWFDPIREELTLDS